MYYVYVCEAHNDITLIYTARRCMRPLPEGGRAGRLFDMIIKQTDNKMENELPKRKPTRLKNFDYSTPGAYFITVCTQHKKCILSRIPVGAIHESPAVKLTEYGKIVDKVINDIPKRFNAEINNYVIMPNHIHLIIVINGNDKIREIQAVRVENCNRPLQNYKPTIL